MINTIIDTIHTFFLMHAPALLNDNIPFMIVASVLVLCTGLYYFTRGPEFAVIAVSSLCFLVPFIKF